MYNKTIEETLALLESSETGLTSAEARERLERYGPNNIESSRPFNPFLILLNQFRSFIIYILLFAVVFSFMIGEYLDSTIILAILLINALIGFFQELSAHKSLEALKKMTTVQAVVLRDNKPVRLDSKDVVPGDILLLEAGDKVPADARIFYAAMLKVEEAALTGESVPAPKHADLIDGSVQIGDQANMLFSSTSVVNGTARAVVSAIGMQTQIGQITSLISESEKEMTPLQKKLDIFGKRLGMVIIAVCLLIFSIFLAKEYFAGGVTVHTFVAIALIVISLAVAAVPEALPAVVTISLSVGVKRLLKKKALVRRLSSVETLGSCDVICTDKTGTLTENKMTVRKAWTLDAEAELDGSGYSPEGELSRSVEPLLFRIGQACNNASLSNNNGEWEITGDPTEAALLVSAGKAGLDDIPAREDEFPFDSERKLMSVLVRDNDILKMYTKGAPDQVLRICTGILTDGKVTELTEQVRQKIYSAIDRYSAEAMRVLAFASKDVGDGSEFIEQGLIFVGLQAMIDPPRPDVIQSIEKTRQAGIRVIMITGDYKETARAIAREVGIEGRTISGDELEKLDDSQLQQLLAEDTNIFARVVPQHKQRIVEALQRSGHTVAMTGDGVNDAPALQESDIGIAVGSGTEVAKEAADFVLLDDSFTHIVNAIEEGRGIYDNIQKSIMLLLSGNLGEVLIIFTAVMIGLNLPLTAVLLLWINMVTDAAPALAYSVDPYDPQIMNRKPRPQDEGILPYPRLVLLAAMGIAGTVIALVLFNLYGGASENEQEIILGQTMVFNFVVLYEAILVFLIRHNYRVPLFSNIWIWASVASLFILQALLMYTPMHAFFKIIPLGINEIGALLLGGLAFFAAHIIYVFSVKLMAAQKVRSTASYPNKGTS